MRLPPTRAGAYADLYADDLRDWFLPSQPRPRRLAGLHAYQHRLMGSGLIGLAGLISTLGWFSLLFLRFFVRHFWLDEECFADESTAVK